MDGTYVVYYSGPLPDADLCRSCCSCCLTETAINDLSNVATLIASSDTGKQWKPYEFKKSYDAKKEDQDSYTCDAILMYCSGSLVEDGTQAQLAVIYYCGVSR